MKNLLAYYKNLTLILTQSINKTENITITNLCVDYNVCPRSSYPFCMVAYFITSVTTSWTYSTIYDIYSRKFMYIIY